MENFIFCTVLVRAMNKDKDLDFYDLSIKG